MTLHRIPQALFRIAAVLAPAVLPACASHLPPGPSRGSSALASTQCQLLAPDAWPARDQSWADAAAALQTPQVVDWFTRTSDGTLTDGKAELRPSTYSSLTLLFGDGVIESATRAGVGVVREIRRPRPERSPENDRENELHHYLAFTTRLPDGSCLVENGTGLVGSARAAIDANAEAIRSAGLVPTDPEPQLALTQGMPFHLDPAWMHTPGFRLPSEQEAPSRGVFFLLLGLGGADADHRALFDELSRRGWRIVLIPTGMIRYTPDRPVRIDADSAESVEAAAAALAGFADQRIAELAYTVEAAAGHLSRTHVELAGKPIVVFGYSAGALAAPAVAARLKQAMPGRLAALVTVCGGSNILDIAEGSIITDASRFLRWTSGPGWSGNGRLLEAYLRHSRLDPAVVGPSLCDTPTLIVKARIDWAVPGRATDRLYDDLGQPDWWSYLAGHESVLERLADDRERFADWLDAAASGRAGGAAAAALSR